MSKMATSSAMKLFTIHLLLLTLITLAQLTWSKSIDEIIQEAADMEGNDTTLVDAQQYNHSDCEVIGEHDMRMTCEQWNLLKGNKIPIKRSSFVNSPIWPRTVPYYFDNSYSSRDKSVVHEAMLEIEMNSCLTFREINENDTSVRNKLKFINGRGCWSYVGMVFATQEICLQTLADSPGCRNPKTTVHEILHALGI